MAGSSWLETCCSMAINWVMLWTTDDPAVSQTRGKVYTIIDALLMASVGVQTRIPLRRYRFSSEPIARSVRGPSAMTPCQQVMFRSSFKPLQNCRWKKDDLASCSLKWYVDEGYHLGFYNTPQNSVPKHANAFFAKLSTY